MPVQAAVIAYGGLEAGSAALFAALFVAGAVDAYIMGQILAPDTFKELGKQNLLIRSASESHKIVYGRSMVGGTVVYIDILDRYWLSEGNVCDTGSGLIEKRIQEKVSQGKDLSMAIALAAHEIDAVEEIYIGTDLVYQTDIFGTLRLVNTDFGGYIDIEFNTGKQTTTGDLINAAINKHYKGKDATELENEAYYKSKGITDITSPNITISSAVEDRAIGYPTLKYDTLCQFEWPEREYGTYNGTYPFDKTTEDGVTPPSEGIPWGDDYVLTNTAYLFVKMRFNADLYESGIPKVRCVIRGKKVYDPRYSAEALTPVVRNAWAAGTVYVVNDLVDDGDDATKKWVCVEAHTATTPATWQEGFHTDFIQNAYWKRYQDKLDATTWQWTDNWALCTADYLTSGNYYARQENDDTDKYNNLYGIGVRDTEIDTANIIAAANISDEQVLLKDASTTPVSSSYVAADSEMSIILTGDQIDYYAKYEKLKIIGTTNPDVVVPVTDTNVYSTPVRVDTDTKFNQLD